MEEGQIKVKQLVVRIEQYPWIKFDSRIKEIEIWDDDGDFHFHENNEEIFIESDGTGYFCELIFKSDITNLEIMEVSKLVKAKMVEHFQKKIDMFNNLIIEINKHN